MPTSGWDHPDIAIVGTGPAAQYLATSAASSGANIVMLEEGLWPLRHQHRNDHAGDVSLETHRGPIKHQVSIGYGGTSRLWGVRIATGERGIRVGAPLPTDLVRPGRDPEHNWAVPLSEFHLYFAKALQRIQPAVSIHGEADPFDGPDLGRFAHPGASSRYYYFGSVEPFQDRSAFLAGLPNVQIRYGTRVADIDTSGQPVLRCLDRETRAEVKVYPAVVVLACGGLESVRILMASPTVAHDNDSLGRYYMDRARYIGERLLANDGVDLDALLPHLQMRAPDWRMAHLQFDPERGSGSRISLTPFPEDVPGRVRTRLQRGVLTVDSYGQQLPGRLAGFGALSEKVRTVNTRVLDAVAHLAGNFNSTNWDYVTRSSRRRPDALRLRGTIEQLPHPENRLTLSEERDVFGLPGLTVDARMRGGELERARQVSGMYADHLEQLGMRRDPSSDWCIESYTSHHHMGGARMGVDPATSVVDADLALHSAPNVYVLSSAVFPSSSYINPTLTTQALALRLGDHLAAHR